LIPCSKRSVLAGNDVKQFGDIDKKLLITICLEAGCEYEMAPTVKDAHKSVLEQMPGPFHHQQATHWRSKNLPSIDIHDGLPKNMESSTSKYMRCFIKQYRPSTIPGQSSKGAQKIASSNNIRVRHSNTPAPPFEETSQPTIILLIA
jgi:hypothetical protein